MKTGARVYQEDVLQGIVKPLNTTVFSGQKWVFQNSAPAHKAKMTQEWLRKNVPAFISAENWSSRSPYLNPLNYNLWAVLEDGLLKALQQPGQPEEIPHESSSRDPPGDSVCCDSRVASAS
jgi:hypothetical protein